MVGSPVGGLTGADPGGGAVSGGQGCGSNRHAAKTGKDIVALGGEKVAITRVNHRRGRGGAGPFEHRASVERGKGAVQQSSASPWLKEPHSY
jgi:hypothetical protein